jgi:hypothetical protein
MFLAYPDYSKVFEIYSVNLKKIHRYFSRQLGAVITQDSRPIAFISWKLYVAQIKYSVTKIELLAIIKILKEFKVMLWGQSIKVITDHKNLKRSSRLNLGPSVLIEVTAGRVWALDGLY